MKFQVGSNFSNQVRSRSDLRRTRRWLKSPNFHQQLLTLALVLLVPGQALADISEPVPIPRPKSTLISVGLAQSLLDWDKEKVTEARNCSEDMKESFSGVSEGVVFDLNYEVLLETHDVFSVVVNLNVYCGGAYPAHRETGVVFDVKTGQRYNLLGLYAIAQERPYGYEFLPEIRDMIRKELLAKRSFYSKNDDCIQVLKDDDIKVFDTDIVALDQKGLRVMYTGPHAVQACYEDIVLPYSRLKRYLNEQEATRINWQR